MSTTRPRTALARAAVVTGTLLAVAMPATSAMANPHAFDPGRQLGADTSFYVPKADHGALEQIASLRSSGDKADADLIRAMIRTPSAVWFTGGTPSAVQHDVKATVQRAAGKKTVPVLVAYDVPGRDCAQYSAGGAATGDAYRAWIAGFAAGLGDHKVVVILEPDGLALLPTDCGQADPYDRVGLIRDAAQVIEQADPNAAVYLDAGHSAWHSTGDMAKRLIAAGVADTQGFFLNVSNYQPTPQLEQYGTWISKCIYYAQHGGNPDWCASQYYPATVSDPSTWYLSDQWYDANVGAVPASELTHFVIDTSRNGQGPWTPDAAYPDPQDWCNPPDRGLGLRPTAGTGNPLVDAFLWVKIPGQSDGQCDRGTGTGTDPARGGTVDPPAGAWFPAQALELVRYANPPLAPGARG